MRRFLAASTGLLAMAGLVSLAAGGCVDGRLRPLTEVEEEATRRDPDGPPLVFITQPRTGQVFLEEVWVSGQGVQVTYGGEFREGDALRLMAYLDFERYSETQPFHVTEFVIQERPSGAVFVRGQQDQFREAVGVTLLLEIHDPQGYLISVDSVNTTIQ